MKINRLINQPFVHPSISDDLSDRLFIQAMLDFELAIVSVREKNHLVPHNTHQQSKQHWRWICLISMSSVRKLI